LCAHFVPHSLTPEQRENRFTSCQGIIAKAGADNFYNNITGEETWCFAFDPKQRDIFLNKLVRHFLGRRNFKGPTSIISL